MDYMSFSFHTEIRKGSYANSVFFMAEVQISYSQKPLVSQKCDIMKRKFKVMVNNSTNINKTNNHLSPSLAEHKKKTDIRNPSYGLGHGAKMWRN